MSAIVLDGHLTKSALACVRSLGKKGIIVYCGAIRNTGPACHSKYVKESFAYTSPKESRPQFVDDIILEAKRLLLQDGEKPVLYCLSDATSLTVARAQAQLSEHMLFVLPELEAIEIAADKQATYELAKKLSIPTIKTYSESVFDGVAYPAVVKNRHSIVWKDDKSVSGSASFVFSKEELIAKYKKVQHETGEMPLVQEFITGEEFGIEMVCKGGEVIASFAHKRIRSLSPRGGAAVIKETARSNGFVELMQQYAQRLCTALAWTGPIMVEFKVDSTDGRVLLMEINGRFWGSLPLPVRAGVDFPMITYKLAKGEVDKLSAFSPKQIRTRHFLGDVQWILRVLFANDPLRKLLYPSRLKAFWDFKTEIFKSKGDIFDLHDLMPSFYEYIDILNKWKLKE